MNVAKLIVRAAPTPPSGRGGYRKPFVFELIADGSGENDVTFEGELRGLRDVSDLLGPEGKRAIRRWVHNSPPTQLLAIVNHDAEANSIIWEYLPRALALPSLSICRLLTTPGTNAPRQPTGPDETPSETAILVAAWTGSPAFQLPGIEQEMKELAKLGPQTGNSTRIRILAEPSLEELASSYEAEKASVLHLIAPYVDSLPPRLLIGAASQDPRDERTDWLEASQLTQAFHGSAPPRLVFINSCDSGGGVQGTTLAESFASEWDTNAVGWAGPVGDREALDFGVFFYQRLLEGASIMGAVRSFLDLDVFESPGPTHRGLVLQDDEPRLRQGPVPVVWTAAVESLTRPFLTTDGVDASTDPVAGRGTLATDPSQLGKPIPPVDLVLRVELEAKSFLNPALLRNGTPALAGLLVTSNRALKGVLLSVSCDTGSKVSTVSETIDIPAGRVPVTKPMSFPALYHLMDEDVRRRQINFTAVCRVDGRVVAQTTQSVLWMGLAEWLDNPDAWHFIPAFVNPYADGVNEVLDVANRALRAIVSPKAAFVGYQEGGGESVAQQVKAIFNTLRDEPFELSYIDVPPLPVFDAGSVWAGQRVRFADEVINRKRGTCHDLSLLLAGCIEAIGIFPIIVLVKGHTFVGYWSDLGRHDAFWNAARASRLREHGKPGREWTIRNPEEICALVSDGSVVLVEATKVTDRNATMAGTQGAIQAAWGRLGFDDGWRNRLPQIEAGFDIAVDVQASRHRIHPL